MTANEDRPAKPLCAIRHKQPAEATDGLLCGHHYAALRETLSDVLELFAMSRLFLLPGSVQADGSKRTKGSEAPPPIRLDVAALSDRRNPATVPVTFLANYDASRHMLVSNGPDIPDVPGVLEDWAGWVVEGRSLTETRHRVVISQNRAVRVEPYVVPLMTPHVRNRWTVASSADVLNRHLVWIAADPLVVEFEESLRDLRRAVALAAGERDATPVGRCPSQDGAGVLCDGPLWPRRDELAVDCGKCQRFYGEVFLRHLGGMLDAS